MSRWTSTRLNTWRSIRSFHSSSPPALLVLSVPNHIHIEGCIRTVTYHTHGLAHSSIACCYYLCALVGTFQC